MKKPEKAIVASALALIGISAAAYMLLPAILQTFRPIQGNFIGLVHEIHNDVKTRYADTFTWQPAAARTELFSKTHIFTGSDSTARLIFLDGSYIELMENSLIFLDFQITEDSEDDKPIKMDLFNGQVSIDLKENSQLKKIKINDTEVDLTDEATTLRLESKEEGGLSASVLKGKVGIKRKDMNYEIEKGKSFTASKDDETEEEAISDELLSEMKRMEEEIKKKREAAAQFQRRDLSQILKELQSIFL